MTMEAHDTGPPADRLQLEVRLAQVIREKTEYEAIANDKHAEYLAAFAQRDAMTALLDAKENKVLQQSETIEALRQRISELEQMCSDGQRFVSLASPPRLESNASGASDTVPAVTLSTRISTPRASFNFSLHQKRKVSGSSSSPMDAPSSMSSSTSAKKVKLESKGEFSRTNPEEVSASRCTLHRTSDGLINEDWLRRAMGKFYQGKAIIKDPCPTCKRMDHSATCCPVALGIWPVLDGEDEGLFYDLKIMTLTDERTTELPSKSLCVFQWAGHKDNVRHLPAGITFALTPLPAA